MALPKDRAASLLATPEDAETQFYDALREGDIERLMTLWAEDEEIVCVHPNGARMVGAQAVRSSFETLFMNASIVVQPEHVRRVQTLSCAMHNVLERVNLITTEGPRTGWVIATNVYIKTTQGWRIVAHHASPGLAGDVPPDHSDAPSVFH